MLGMSRQSYSTSTIGHVLWVPTCEGKVSEGCIFYLLDHLLTGYDGLQEWFLRLTALACAGVIAHLIQLSITHTHCPIVWSEKTKFGILKNNYESCLMVGTRKPMKNLKKILVSSAPNREPKFQKLNFFLEKCLFSCFNFLFADI